MAEGPRRLVTLARHESAKGQTRHTLPKVRRPLPKDESEDRQIRREPNAQYRQYGLHECSFRLSRHLRDSFSRDKIPPASSQGCECSAMEPDRPLPGAVGLDSVGQKDARATQPKNCCYDLDHRTHPVALEGRTACVATSGPSLGRKRPRRAAIAGWGLGGRYRIPLAKTTRSAAQLSVGKRRAPKGVTE